MTSFLVFLFAANASGCPSQRGALPVLAESVSAAGIRSQVTVTAEVIGTFEVSDGYEFTSVPGTFSGPKVLTLNQIHELSRSEGTVDGFRIVTSQGNFLAGKLTVHVPGKGEAEFRPMIYGYPESPSQILPAALKLIDWQQRSRSSTSR